MLDKEIIELMMTAQQTISLLFSLICKLQDSVCVVENKLGKIEHEIKVVSKGEISPVISEEPHAFDLNTLVSDVFNKRTVNCLKNIEVRTFGDLIKQTEMNLIRIPNFGRISLREVREFLDSHNLSLSRK